MHVVYLIISHTNSGQVARFAGVILGASPAGQVVVVHNKADPCPDISPWVAAGRAHVLPYGPRVYWGDFSLTAKVLYGLRWALANIDCDWLVLLSGQDYLLRPLAALEDELRTTPYDAFISGVPIASGQPCGALECALAQRPAPSCRRCQELYLYQYWRAPVGGLARVAINWVNRRAGDGGTGLPLLRHQRLAQRGSRGATLLGVRAAAPPFGPDFPCYKGMLWFTASRRALAALVDAVDRSPGLVRYYRRTILPDESLFITHLKNPGGLLIGEDTQHFVNWLDGRSPSPAVVREADFDRLVASGAFFGRKFDSRVDEAILDRFDAHRARWQQRPGADMPPVVAPMEV